MSWFNRFTHRHAIPSPSFTEHGSVWAWQPATCSEYDEYARDLERRNLSLQDRIDAANGLMAGAFQMVLNLGDHLRNTLFGDDLSGLKLTSDWTAVKYDGASYTVIIRPFQKKDQITLQPAPGLNVSPVVVSVVNGTLSERTQTMLLGGVGRIRVVAAGSPDPVGDAQLVSTPSSSEVGATGREA